jgi:hypothetical protein
MLLNSAPLYGAFRAGTNRYKRAVHVRTTYGDPTGYRFAAAMSQCLRLTRKTRIARTVIARQADLNRLAQLARQEHAPGMTCGYRAFRVLERGVHREFTLAIAKHSKLFSLIDCISVAFD